MFLNCVLKFDVMQEGVKIQERKEMERSEQASGEGQKIEKLARTLVRIANTDIPGNKRLYYGLAQIYGISCSFSNAICEVLNLDRNRKIESLKQEEIKGIEEFLKKPTGIPSWMLNRKKDYETGEDIHLTGSNLKLRREFDIRFLKKVKSYRGVRHALGLPVRGQRTKSHFRKGGAVGVMKKAAKIAAAAKFAEEKKGKKEK